jgi:hypothetical protein
MTILQFFWFQLQMTFSPYKSQICFNFFSVGRIQHGSFIPEMVLGDEDKQILAEALQAIADLTPDQITTIRTALDCLPNLTTLSSAISVTRRAFNVHKAEDKGIQPLSKQQKDLRAQPRTAHSPGYCSGLGAGGHAQKLVPGLSFSKRQIPTIRKPESLKESPAQKKKWTW